MLELSFLYVYPSIFPLQASKTRNCEVDNIDVPSQVTVKAARTVFVAW